MRFKGAVTTRPRAQINPKDTESFIINFYLLRMPFPTSGLSSVEPSVVKWNGIRYITSFLTSLVLSVLYEMRKEVHTISSLISPSHRRGWSSSIPSPRILVSLISSSFLSEPEATGWKEIRILLSDPKEMSK